MFNQTTIKEITTDQIERLPFTLLAGFTGGLLFTWVQTITGTNDIAKFLGDSIVAQGGYATRFAQPIGWTVHMTIATSYAFLFSTIYTVFLRTGQGWSHATRVLLTAAGVGVVTTWIANPAISITIPLLAGTGLPETIAPVYFKLGVPFWNHLIFFAYSAGLIGYGTKALAACRMESIKETTTATDNRTIKLDLVKSTKTQVVQ